MLKRLFDLAIIALTAPVWIPVLIVVAVIVRWRIGSPVLFIQSRPGLRSRLFRLVKFRTMTLATDSSGQLLPDSERLTVSGKFLRSTSLDELPEVWNVIRGDMSLVGPRPLLADYLPIYSPIQARRHEVRPGLTGWAQINGRNAITWEQRFALDLWYVDNRSFLLDVKILLRTAVLVLKRDGISAEGEATMHRFESPRKGS